MELDTTFVFQTYQESTLGGTKESEANRDKLKAKDISDSYLAQYQIKISQNTNSELNKQIDVFTLEDIGYKGKPIGDLSQEEAKDLVSEDGFFGINQTSQRVYDFVVNGAKDDINLLKAGRDGVVQGYNEAEELWGGELPEISQKTFQKTLDMIDAKLRDLGANAIDTTA